MSRNSAAVMSLITPEAIDRVFELVGTGALPKFVPAMPSIILGLVVGLVLLLSGLLLSMWDRYQTKGDPNVFVRTRWIIGIVVAVFVAGMAGDTVQNKHYTIRCIVINKQHFANVHWLRLYRRAFMGNHANV